MKPTDKYVVMHGNIICHQGAKDECYEWLRLRHDNARRILDYTAHTEGRQWIVGRADLLITSKSLIDTA